MDETRITLLDELTAGTETAWREVDRLYRPLIFSWLRQFDIQPVDREDLTQEVMSKLLQQIAKFQHNGRVGAFRNWLKTITANQARDFIRSGRLRPRAAGDCGIQSAIAKLDDPSSDVSRVFDVEHDSYIIRKMLDAVSSEFEQITLSAFRMHVLDSLDANTVADELGTTPGNVYVAKSRVLRRLRERVSQWTDEFSTSKSRSND